LQEWVSNGKRGVTRRQHCSRRGPHQKSKTTIPTIASAAPTAVGSITTEAMTMANQVHGKRSVTCRQHAHQIDTKLRLQECRALTKNRPIKQIDNAIGQNTSSGKHGVTRRQHCNIENHSIASAAPPAVGGSEIR
jgi:hypothetical protein